MKKHNRHIIHCLPIRVTASIILLAMAVASCSTGIESTKTIRMSKDDMKLMEKSDEQRFASDIKGSPLSEWQEGKPFQAMSARTLYIFQPSSVAGIADGESIKGKTLIYAGRRNETTPDLQQQCILVFTDGENSYRYPTGKTEQEALRETDSSKIPLMSDLTLTEEWRQKLLGKTLWTKSNLWYDKNGERRTGLKFAKVEVKDVTPATGDFPMRVKVAAEDGSEAYMNMNYTSDLADSRNFSALFYLSDPKNKYPQISEENWDLIKKGKIGLGMTKEECRLSLGNPDELRAGHNTSNTVDMWQYTNGTYLMFTDGILTRFRQ